MAIRKKMTKIQVNIQEMRKNQRALPVPLYQLYRHRHLELFRCIFLLPKWLSKREMGTSLSMQRTERYKCAGLVLANSEYCEKYLKTRQTVNHSFLA